MIAEMQEELQLHVVVVVLGELDVATSPALAQYADHLATQPYTTVLFDMRPVTFIDCRGIGALVHARNLLGTSLCLQVSPCVEQLLALTGLRRHFNIAPASNVAAGGGHSPLS